MTKEELEKATGQELIDARNYCGVDSYYGDYLDNVNAEMLKRFNRLAELEKENAELDCQKNRNKFCYSCANATERCFRNEIGCPCEKYKSYKDENAELKKACDETQELLDKQIEATYKLDKENAELKEMYHEIDEDNNKLRENIPLLAEAKELFKGWLEDFYSPKTFCQQRAKLVEQSERFLSEVEK
jgi:hypothetical protein